MDEKVFCARVKDTAQLCAHTDKPKFLGFLTESEIAKAQEILKTVGVGYEFFGGFEQADRLMLCCKPDWCEEVFFPIVAVTATFRECDNLSHRDILGSLMGLGITRESVGDILIEKGRAVFFITEEIADFVLSELTRAGRVGIRLKVGADYPLPQLSSLVTFRETVASPRLDCVVAAILKISRARAEALVEDGFVSINSAACLKTTRLILANDKITVRGKGKFIVNSLADKTKKGRTVLEYSKYV